MNYIIMWLVILVILVVVELATMGLTTIWFAGGALVATIASALNAPVEIQFTLFIGVSVLLLIFTRPIAMKYFNKTRVKTNVEGLIGKQATVIEDIDNGKAVGAVIVEGQEWSARAAVETEVLKSGINATVVGISGIKLVVEERGN